MRHEISFSRSSLLGVSACCFMSILVARLFRRQPGNGEFGQIVRIGGASLPDSASAISTGSRYLVWSLHRGDARLDRALQLFERTHLNLAYSLARDTEFGRKFLERDRVISQSTRLEDASFALVENVQRRDQRLVPIVALFALGKNALLAWCVVDEPILPLAALAIIADRSVERRIAAETAVHVDHILFRDTE